MSNPKRLQGLPFFIMALAFMVLGATSPSSGPSSASRPPSWRSAPRSPAGRVGPTPSSSEPRGQLRRPGSPRLDEKRRAARSRHMRSIAGTGPAYRQVRSLDMFGRG